MVLEWRLKKIRLREQKKLNSTNLSLFKSMVSYIQCSELREVEKEDILQQIMDMMLQAQIENKPVDLFIGNDYEVFCKSIIEEYSSDKNFIYKLLNHIQKYLVWMISISLVIAIVGVVSNESLNLSITLEQLILANAIALIIVPISKIEKRETTSLSLYQRLFIYKGINTKSAYAFIVFAVLVLGSQAIIKTFIGAEALNYTIYFINNILYVFMILLIIGSIEVYKVLYNKR